MINTVVDALLAWHSLPECERYTYEKSELPAVEKRELIRKIAGHLDAQMLAIDLASLLRMIWAGATNEEAGSQRNDLINSLSVCEELATLIARVAEASYWADEVKKKL